ncbi:MAG TPA: transporter [Phycisphaerae bacterium]|nr:transporter [Phycisphaerae bacterium]
MNRSRILLTSLGTVLAMASAGRAQDSVYIKPVDDKPMSLTSDDVKTTEKKTDESKPFWIFGEAAPLTSPIVTDRPGFSDSASLVPRGHFQVESGYTFTYDREGHSRTIDHNMPELALRTGLTDWLEFRAQWTGYSYTETLNRIKTPAGRTVNDTNHDDGCRDTNFGFKVPLLQQKDWMPTISLITTLYVPSGADSKRPNNTVPEWKLPWNYSFCKEFTAYGSILGRVVDADEGEFYQTAATLAGGYHVTDKLTLYLEYYGVYPSNRTQDCAHLLSGGPIIQITDNLSLDMRAAVGLNEQAPDFQASIGFGIRF